jgi:hypothetical protein
MKTLNNYTEQPIAEAMTKAGAFFAFGNKQFDEQKKEGIKYISMGMGLICPKENADQLAKDMDEAIKKGKADYKADLKARADALKIEQLPPAERINNRIILIQEASSRINNYMDDEAIAEYQKELQTCKPEEINGLINNLLSAISWRKGDRPEVADLYEENINEIKELWMEISGIIDDLKNNYIIQDEAGTIYKITSKEAEQIRQNIESEY